jgi:predicted component of type VI protein secretion system
MDLRAMKFPVTESVWLRLVRGSSREPVRMLPADLADGVVSVGASDGCDWQIAADEVPPLAFSLKAIAGSLFVCAADSAELRVDGHEVGSMWLPVELGARLSVGGALIEVGLAGRSRSAQHAQLQRAFGGPSELDAPAANAEARPLEPGNAEATRLEPGWLGCGGDANEAPQEEPAAREREPALDWASTLLEEADGPRALARETLPPCEQLWSATIFGAEELPAGVACAAQGADSIEPYVRWGSAGLWIAGSLLACAYGCWVLLLDHF